MELFQERAPYLNNKKDEEKRKWASWEKMGRGRRKRRRRRRRRKNKGVMLTNTVCVTRNVSDPFSPCDVPNLNQAIVCAHSKVSALLQPANRSHGVIRSNAAELCDTAGGCAPEVNVAPEANTEDVLRRPIKEVEVEIILELWRIEDLEGRLGDVTGRMTRRWKDLIKRKEEKRRRGRRLFLWKEGGGRSWLRHLLCFHLDWGEGIDVSEGGVNSNGRVLLGGLELKEVPSWGWAEGILSCGAVLCGIFITTGDSITAGTKELALQNPLVSDHCLLY
jgi:hypothetical protein